MVALHEFVRLDHADLPAVVTQPVGHIRAFLDEARLVGVGISCPALAIASRNCCMRTLWRARTSGSKNLALNASTATRLPGALSLWIRSNI